MSKAFWRGFWEGMNPLFTLAWVLYYAGYMVSVVMRIEWEPVACLYPVYNRLMCWSSAVQDRFGFSGPWTK
jgi:cytochrome c oxidase subunit IV